jgi:type IX secretion system PorP/SprF family membrane protein
MGANVQFPANDRVALGFSILSDKQVLVRNTNFMGTFGYVVPITTNQSLRFGLSAGVGINKLDLTAEELNTNDPAILNASGNNFYVDGNFGVVYNNGGLRVGFALTDLFKSSSFNTESFNKFELSNLRNRLFSASYRFDLDPMGNVSMEPYFLYRQTEDGLQDSWEAASLVYFKDKLWTGVSYKQNNGIALFLGMNLKEKFRFSYSYEFPPFNSRIISSSSHELHLGIRLGKKKSKFVAKKATQAVPELANVKDEELSNHPSKLEGGKNPERIVKSDEPQPAHVKTPIEIKEEEKAATPGKTEIKKAPSKTSVSKLPESFTMTRGHHYVVVGVFSVMNHSMHFTKELMGKGYAVSVALNPKNKFYYVYIQSTLDLDEAKKIRNEYRLKNLFKESWIFTME